MTSSKGDRQSPHRQMVVRSNNEYLQVSAQTNVYYPSVQWSLSVNDTFIDSREIHQQKALIPPIELFVILLKMPDPLSDVIFSYVQLWKSNTSLLPWPASCYYAVARCFKSKCANSLVYNPSRLLGEWPAEINHMPNDQAIFTWILKFDICPFSN